jgi:hypothetical protein
MRWRSTLKANRRCTGRRATSYPMMSGRASRREVVERLEEQGIAYEILALHNGVALAVIQRGGRLFLFLPDGESVFWLHEAFGDPNAFAKLVDRGEWNIGGERIWISPEVQFNIRDRRNVWASYHLPERIDPGRWALECIGEDTCRLSQDLSLEAYNTASGQKKLAIERCIRPADDPLRNLTGYLELTCGVVFAGYEHTVTLAEADPDGISCQSWGLIQLRPRGTVVVPASPRAELTEYLEPSGSSVESRHDHVQIHITGDRRFKVGIKAAHLFGRLAFLSHLNDGRACLIVRNFFNNPSAPYIEEPPQNPGRWGDSVHIYNDSGALGGFGELECFGQAIGGDTGRISSSDPMVLWLYVGPEERIEDISLHLLGFKAKSGVWKRTEKTMQ